jgi:hypothetical protein
MEELRMIKDMKGVRGRMAEVDSVSVSRSFVLLLLATRSRSRAGDIHLLLVLLWLLVALRAHRPRVRKLADNHANPRHVPVS